MAPLGPNGPEPLIAIYRKALLPELERRIAAGALALQPLLREIDPQLAALRNVNRPEDLS